jgi:hypothetical protein
MNAGNSDRNEQARAAGGMADARQLAAISAANIDHLNREDRENEEALTRGGLSATCG